MPSFYKLNKEPFIISGKIIRSTSVLVNVNGLINQTLFFFLLHFHTDNTVCNMWDKEYNHLESFWSKPCLICNPYINHQLTQENAWKILEWLADDCCKTWVLSLYIATNTMISLKLTENGFCIISHHSESWHIVLALIDFVLCSTLHFATERGIL